MSIIIWWPVKRFTKTTKTHEKTSFGERLSDKTKTKALHHCLGEQMRQLLNKETKKILLCLNTVLDYHYQRKTKKSKEGHANGGSSRSSRRSQTDKMSEDKDRDF